MDVIDETVAAEPARDPEAARFDAFISYSHALDGRLAPALQQALQSLGKPWYRRRVLHVFRDHTSLTASPGLWDDIERALSDSRFFILLASPEAAQSPWVRKEVSWWLEHRRPQQLLIAITDGGIAWDHEAGSFDPERSSALPDVLLRCFAQEPLWVDLRWARAEQQLSPRDPHFRGCVADLAAPVRGMAKDDLIGEDIRNHRRALRLAWGAAAALAVLAAAAVVAAIIAIGQRNAAQQQTRLATSRQLAAQAQADAPSRLDTALLLSRAAWRTAQTPQALASLLSASTASPQLVALTTQQPGIASLTAAPDASLVATGAVDGSIRLWRPRSGAPVPRVAAPARSAITALALEGEHLVAGDAAGQVGVYSLSSRTWIWPVQTQAQSVTAVGVDAAGGLVASAAVTSGTGNSTVELSRAVRDAPVVRLTVSPISGRPVTQIVFDGTRFVVGAATGQIFAWSLIPPAHYLGTSTQFTAQDGQNTGAYSPDMDAFETTGGGVSKGYVEATTPGGSGSSTAWQIQFPPTAPNPALAVALAPGGRSVAVSSSAGVTVLDAIGTSAAKAALATTMLTGLASSDLVAFPDQDHVVARTGNTLSVWNLRQLSRVAREFASPLQRASLAVERPPTAVTPDGRHATWVAPTRSSSSQEMLDCSDLRSLRVLSSRGMLDEDVYSVAYDASGTRLVTGGAGTIRVWQVRSGCPTQQLTSAQVGSNVQIRAAGFRDARTVVAVADDGSVRVIDASSGRQLRNWRVPYRGFTSTLVTAAAIRGDGALAAIGLETGRLVEVDTHTGAARSPIGAHAEGSNLQVTSIRAVAWSPDGRDIAAVEGNGDVVVLGPSGQTLMDVQGLGAESVQFLLGGSALMGVDAQGTAHVWEIASGSILSDFPVEHFAPPPRDVVFQDLGGGTSLTPVPGSSRLLVTDLGAYPAIFDFGLPGLLRDACQTAGRQLTAAEIEHLAAPAPPDAWSCPGP